MNNDTSWKVFMRGRRLEKINCKGEKGTVKKEQTDSGKKHRHMAGFTDDKSGIILVR
jgi:hypothetical protein